VPTVDKLPMTDALTVPGPNAIMLTPVDTNGKPVAPGENRLVPTNKPAQKTATSSQVPAKPSGDSATAAAVAAASALAAQTNSQLKPIKKVIGIVDNSATDDATLDAEAELLADTPGFKSPMTSLPVNQTAANVPLDAYEVDPTKGATAPVMILMSVLLPAPFSPMSACTSPARSSSEALLSACTPA